VLAAALFISTRSFFSIPDLPRASPLSRYSLNTRFQKERVRCKFARFFRRGSSRVAISAPVNSRGEPSAIRRCFSARLIDGTRNGSLVDLAEGGRETRIVDARRYGSTCCFRARNYEGDKPRAARDEMPSSRMKSARMAWN